MARPGWRDRSEAIAAAIGLSRSSTRRATPSNPSSGLYPMIAASGRTAGIPGKRGADGDEQVRYPTAASRKGAVLAMRRLDMHIATAILSVCRHVIADMDQCAAEALMRLVLCTVDAPPEVQRREGGVRYFCLDRVCAHRGLYLLLGASLEILAFADGHAGSPSANNAFPVVSLSCDMSEDIRRRENLVANDSPSTRGDIKLIRSRYCRNPGFHVSHLRTENSGLLARGPLE